MAGISKISLPSGTEYDLKDATARSGLAGKQDTIDIAYLVDSSGSFLSVALELGYTQSDLESMSIEELVGFIADLGVNYPEGSAGTVTSVGLTNATNGGLSISGSPITSSGTITIGHSNVLPNAYTTEAILPIAIDKNGHITSYGTAITPMTALNIGADVKSGTSTVSYTSSVSPNNYYWIHPGDNISLDSYSATGTTNKTGVTINAIVPTKTSDLTNDSGFITSDSDEKLKTTTVAASNTVYYPIFGQNNNVASTKYYSSKFSIMDSSTLGTILQLGQNSSNGRKGSLILVSSHTSFTGTLRTSATADRTWTLPDATGTIALTSNIPANVSDLTNDSGYITLDDIPTVPTIRLNGVLTTTPEFYAPTTVGSSGQYLVSSGTANTAPTWANFPTIPSITLNGSASTSPSFYAPTSAGTPGYYLKSNGSGAPTWAEVTAGISDVTVAGTSVVTNSVAVIAAPVQIVRW